MAAILYAGVVPLDLHVGNDVRWLDPGPGLQFGERGIAYSDAPLDWPAATRPGEISVELWVRPAGEPGGRLAQIFSIFDGDAVEPLLIAQWKSGLVIRNRVSGRGRGFRELGSLGMLFRDQPRMIALTSGPDGTVVYLDGRATEHRSNIPIIGPEEAFGGRLVLGNSATGTAPWSGDLLGVAVYRRALDAAEVAEHHAAVATRGVAGLAWTADPVVLYPFGERTGDFAASTRAKPSSPPGPPLLVPMEFERLRMPVLQLPDFRERSVYSYARDAVVNLLGFAPLGFFAVALLCRRARPVDRAAVLGIVAFGFALSLAIELLQVRLPTRVSSAADLLWNTSGAALGAWLALRGPPPFRRTR